MAAKRPSSAVHLLMALTDVALASATCPGGWARFEEDGKCYKVTAGRFNALGCAAACGENATLACIRSSAEADFVSSLTRSVGDVWIGLYQSAGAAEPGGGWDMCPSGVTTNFTNWLSGYPSNFYRTMIFRDLGEMSYANRQCAAKRRAYLRNGWFDSPCYLRNRCLCELGAPASAEYLAFMEADIAKGQQLLRTLTAILYGGLIPAAWLVPLAFFCALLACLRLRRKKARGQDAGMSQFKGLFKGSDSWKGLGSFTGKGAKSATFPREKRTREKLTDAVAKADRLRLRVSGTLVLLGWMLLAVGAVPPIFANVIDVDLTPIASNIVSYYFALPPGAAVILLALRPTYAYPIHFVGVLGVFFSAAALYGALVPLWSVASTASTDGLSVFTLSIIRSSGLALIAAVACVLFWHTVSVRFVCRSAAQVKSLDEAMAAEEKAPAAWRPSKSGLFKAIQSQSKNTATVAIQSHAFRIRVLTMPPLNLWFAFRLAFIRGGVVYYHNLKTNEASLGKPDELKLRGGRNAEKAAAKPDELEGELEAAQERAVVAAQTAWMEFTLEYTMGARSQLLRLWLTLRVVCIGIALLYLVVFLSMMLYVPSVDLYGPDPVEAGAIQNVIHSAVALAVALVFTPANRGRFVAWLGALGKSGMAATARKEATDLRSRVDELRQKGKLSQEEQEVLSKSEDKLLQLESKVQKLEAEGEATALAALIGKLSPAEAIKLGTERFRALPLAKLTREEIAGRKVGTFANDWKSSPGWPTRELFAKTFWAKFGKVDAFVSHSWSDDGDAKFDRLHEWAVEEKEKEKEKADTAAAGASELTRAGAVGKVTDDGNGGIAGVTIWLDKACLDQRDIQASLAGLPFFISGCKQLLVLAGPTYASRLWCVIELFVFVQLTPRVQDRMRVMSLTSKDKTSEEVAKDFKQGLLNFDAGKAETFDPNDRERLMAVIEAAFGTFDPFNKIVRDISKVYYKRILAERAKVKGHAPELLARMSTQQLRRVAADISERPMAQTIGRNKFKALSQSVSYFEVLPRAHSTTGSQSGSATVPQSTQGPREEAGANDKEKSRSVNNITEAAEYV